MINTEFTNLAKSTERHDLIDYRLEQVDALQYYVYNCIAVLCIVAAILNLLLTWQLLIAYFGESKCLSNLFEIWFGILFVDFIIMLFINLLHKYTHYKCNLVAMQCEMSLIEFLNS